MFLALLSLAHADPVLTLGTGVGWSQPPTYLDGVAAPYTLGFLTPIADTSLSVGANAWVDVTTFILVWQLSAGAEATLDLRFPSRTSTAFFLRPGLGVAWYSPPSGGGGAIGMFARSPMPSLSKALSIMPSSDDEWEADSLYPTASLYFGWSFAAGRTHHDLGPRVTAAIPNHVVVELVHYEVAFDL